jgi:hypothetical protein
MCRRRVRNAFLHCIPGKKYEGLPEREWSAWQTTFVPRGMINEPQGLPRVLYSGRIISSITALEMYFFRQAKGPYAM